MISLKPTASDRNRKTEVPFGWTQVDKTTKDGKTVKEWRCPHIHRNGFTNKVERCSYTCRKDRTVLKHYHEYKIPPEIDDLLPDEYKKENNSYTNQSFNKNIEELAARFIGSTSISSSVACSEQFRSLICNISLLSIDFFLRSKSILKDPRHIVKRINKNSINQSLISEGCEAFNSMMNSLSKFRFVNLMIDAATVNNMRVVHTTISNPYSCMAPLPFHSTKKDDEEWGIEQYQEELESIFTEISSYNMCHDESEQITVISICHDRLACQSAAVSKLISSFQSIPEYNLVADISCLNHLIHNSFLSTINNCENLRAIIPHINEIIVNLRKREAVKFIGKKIPSHPKTRWIYLCDSLSFIFKNIEKVNLFLINDWMEKHNEEEYETLDEFTEMAQQAATIRPEIIELYLVLLPLQKASLCFECEQSRIGDVVHVVQVMITFYEKLLVQSYISLEWSLEILHELLAQFLSHLETYLPSETWASWALSRSGRFDLRSINASSGIVIGNICDYENPTYSVNEAAKNMEDEINYILQLIDQNNIQGLQKNDSEEEDDIDEEEETSDETMNDELNCEINSTDKENELSPPSNSNFDQNTMNAINHECSLNLQYRQSLKLWREKDLSDMIKFDIAFEGYDKALNIIKQHYHHYDEEISDADITNLFDQWLFNSGGLFSEIGFNQSNDFLMWQEFSKHDQVRILSLVALRLLSIGTSESDVERLISMHRFLVHDRMSNLSPKVLLARLRMRAKAITDNSIQGLQKK